MDTKTYLKYGGATLLFGALFYLTLSGKMQPGDFKTLCVTALGLLFGHQMGTGGKNAP